MIIIIGDIVLVSISVSVLLLPDEFMAIMDNKVVVGDCSGLPVRVILAGRIM